MTTLSSRLARLTPPAPMNSPLGAAASRPTESVTGVSLAADARSAVRAQRIANLEEMLADVLRRHTRRLRGDSGLPIETEPCGAGAVGAGELPGKLLPGARVRKVRTELEPDHHHGKQHVARALGVNAARFAQLALEPDRPIDVSKLLFFDTETTGLVRGTGTVPFLVGLGFFEDERLVVEQYFLEELGDERPVLELLAERLSDPEVTLVSFNGKSYDEPLVATRAVLHRLPWRRTAGHVDLVHCARRIYRGTMSRMRLQDLEREHFGFRRERDIDGAEIPEAYFAYLRHRRPHAMNRVITHNLHDIVALAALVGHLTDGLDVLDRRDAPEVQLGRARVAYRVGDVERALAFAAEAAVGGGAPECTFDACRLAAGACRRAGRFDRAVGWWLEALASAAGEWALATVHLELAKLYEHRLRDLQAALRHAELSAPAEDPGASARRVERIIRKLSR